MFLKTIKLKKCKKTGDSLLDIKELTEGTNVYYKDVKKAEWETLEKGSVALKLFDKKGNLISMKNISSLERERLLFKKMGKKKYIKKLVKSFNKGIENYSVLDIIKEEFELFEQYIDYDFLEKIRFLDDKEAKKEYSKRYKKQLKNTSKKKLYNQI